MLSETQIPQACRGSIQCSTVMPSFFFHSSHTCTGARAQSTNYCAVHTLKLLWWMQASCQLPKNGGSCLYDADEINAARYAFIAESGQCELVWTPTQDERGWTVYQTGCPTQRGFYNFIEDCNAACMSPPPAPAPPPPAPPALPERCTLPIKPGGCLNAVYRRWAYDVSKGECVTFFYTGCEGNDNRFNKEQKCKDACVL